MPFNGSGIFLRLYNWVNDAQANINIRADRMDNEMNGMATGLSNCITKDGQTTVIADLPMASYKHINVGNATSRNQYATFGQLQDGTVNWVLATGTSDVIQANYLPAIGTLVDGQLFFVRSSAANTTTTPTFSPNGQTARTIVKNANSALDVGDIPSVSYEMILRYRSSDTKYVLLNPFVKSFSQSITINGTTTEAAYINLLEDSDNGTNKVKLQAPADLAADVSVTLPASGGTLARTDDIKQVLSIGASVASNALTVTLDPMYLNFRSATLASGAIQNINIPSTLSMTVSSGSTLGTVNGVLSTIVVLAINNGGTIELAVTNLAGSLNLDETGLISTTAEGGAGAADSVNVIYSTTARSNVPYRVVGFVQLTQATAGTWATAPSKVQGVGGEAFTALGSAGFGQTWQSVSRTAGTTYYNTTGKQIIYHAEASALTIAPWTTSVNINGFSLVFSSGPNISNARQVASIEIPAGASYVFTDINCQRSSEAELR